MEEAILKIQNNWRRHKALENYNKNNNDIDKNEDSKIIENENKEEAILKIQN
jgi:hypothetical protein